MTLTRRGLLGAAASLAPLYAARASSDIHPSALVMGTGQPGGAFTVFGPAWGDLITASTGEQMVYRATGGSSANLLLIEEGTAQLGLSTLPVALQAHNGTGGWTAGVKLSQFRVLFPAFPSILQIVSTATGARTLADLAGKPIGIGPAGASGAVLMQPILKSLGITPSHTEKGDYAPQLHKLFTGELAACAFFGAPPVTAISDVAVGHQLRLIGFSTAQARQVALAVPGISRMILKAGTFPGQSLDVDSIGALSLSVGTADLPTSLVEKITLAALRHRSRLAAAVPAAAMPEALEPLYAAGLRFHPGAVKALKMAGYHLPKSAI